MSETLLEYGFPARPEELKEVRQRVQEALERADLSAAYVRDVVLAVDEACQNIVRHAYVGDSKGEILLGIQREENRLLLSLRDFAPPIDLSKVHPRALDDVRPGGLGTYLMQSLMDEVHYRRPPMGEGNLLEMVKKVEHSRDKE